MAEILRWGANGLPHSLLLWRTINSQHTHGSLESINSCFWWGKCLLCLQDNNIDYWGKRLELRNQWGSHSNTSRTACNKLSDWVSIGATGWDGGSKGRWAGPQLLGEGKRASFHTLGACPKQTAPEFDKFWTPNSGICYRLIMIVCKRESVYVKQKDWKFS